LPPIVSSAEELQMAIDFRQSLDRYLAAFSRPQGVVRAALAAGTRRVRGRDDSHGAVHRAAAGSTLLSQTIYALTYFVAPRRERSDTDATAAADRAAIYVKLGAETYAVWLVPSDPAPDDDCEWQASRIVRVDELPAAA
jgi:hypothetical protein